MLQSGNNRTLKHVRLTSFRLRTLTMSDDDSSILGKHARDNDLTKDMNIDPVEEDDDIGPMPMPETGTSTARKRRRGKSQPFAHFKILNCVVLPHERLFLDHLPSADRYFKSFMHRDTVNFVISTM